MRKALVASLAAVVFSLVPIGTWAFTMEPMSTLLAPSGPGRVATFRITNDGPERVAIRLSVLARATSPKGEEINTPAEELFIVYPDRLLVEPGATATAKVQWRGPARIGAEQSYRLVAEQVAIDAATARNGTSGIKIMFRYIASLYVGEGSFAPSLVSTIVGATGPRGESGYLVEISNIGQRHLIPNNLRIQLEGEDIPLSGMALGALSGSNYLAGTGRSLFVPSPYAIPGKTYEGTLLYESAD